MRSVKLGVLKDDKCLNDLRKISLVSALRRITVMLSFKAHTCLRRLWLTCNHYAPLVIGSVTWTCISYRMWVIWLLRFIFILQFYGIISKTDHKVSFQLITLCIIFTLQ